VVELYKDYFKEANNNVITMAMIETPAAYKNIEDIAAAPTSDGLFGDMGFEHFYGS
jgi:2-keto-3-deoxy-L-rhamnonate aldolase RhmA